MVTPQRILCLVGVLTFLGDNDPMWKNWRKAFAQTHPDLKVEVAHHFYLPWQRKRIQTYAENILKTYDDGIPSLLFGYSLGGAIAHHVAGRFKRTPVTGIYTLCAPLRLMSWFKLSRNHVIRSLSFAALFDIAVPYPLCKLDGVPTHPLWVNHLTTFLFSPAACLHVARHIQKDTLIP